MALIKFNEGSLLRRTLVHVGTFVVGSVAFISLMSLVLVSVARGIMPSAGSPSGATTASEQREGDATQPTRGVKASSRKPTSLTRPAVARDQQ